jgi:hypothetical protein
MEVSFVLQNYLNVTTKNQFEIQAFHLPLVFRR